MYNNLSLDRLKKLSKAKKLKLCEDKDILIKQLEKYDNENPTNIMVLDTETTGLPKTKGFGRYYLPSDLDKYESSRLVELGYIIYDKRGNYIKKYQQIVKPDKFKIKNSKFHGISNKKANSKGISCKNVLNNLYEDIKSVNLIVAHNIKFDLNIILSECYRYQMNELIGKLESINTCCTAEESYLRYGRYMKLTHLYETLFDKEIDQKHRALSDARYCAKCYFKTIN